MAILQYIGHRTIPYPRLEQLSTGKITANAVPDDRHRSHAHPKCSVGKRFAFGTECKSLTISVRVQTARRDPTNCNTAC